MTDGTPTLISGRPNDAVGVTTRRSHARASSNAAPRQYPLTTATVTTGECRIACMTCARSPISVRARGRCQASESLDVHSGAEGRLARAREQNRLHASSEIGDDVAKLGQVLRMQDVELLWPIEGDPEGTAEVFCLDIPHVLTSPYLRAVGAIAMTRAAVKSACLSLDLQARGEQPQLSCALYRRGAILGLELRVDVAYVCVDGVHRDR